LTIKPADAGRYEVICSFVLDHDATFTPRIARSKCAKGRLRRQLGMLDLPATIAFLKYLRRDLAKDIAELEAGRIRIEKMDDHADITVERLAEQKHRLGNLDQAIAVYEYC
jgi:hypothetical protein